MFYVWSSFNQFYRKNTHLLVVEKSFTDAVQIICMACICKRCANQLDKNSIDKISLSDSNIDNNIDSDENMEVRDNPHDDILDSELVVEDKLFNEISVENFLSDNDSNNVQISKEDLNEFFDYSKKSIY